MSPRTAKALGLRPHAQRNVAHMDEWGGDLGSLMASAANTSRQRPSAQIATQQSNEGVVAQSNVPDAYSNASTNRRQSRPQQEWSGDLGSVLASAPVKTRIPRSRVAHAAREQTSNGVLSALTNDNGADVRRRPARDGDFQVRRNPPSNQPRRPTSSSEVGRAGAAEAGVGGGGDDTTPGPPRMRESRNNLEDMQLSPVRTDALPSAAPNAAPRLSAASVRASQQREARIDERIRELDMQLRLHARSGELAAAAAAQQHPRRQRKLGDLSPAAGCRGCGSHGTTRTRRCVGVGR